MNIQDYIIAENNSIEDAMKSINASAAGIAFVCKEDRLVAAVSDGDIRRALLDKISVTESVSKIANYSPVFLHMAEKKKADELMREKSITALPLVNSEGRIQEIRFLYKKSVNNKPSLNVPVVIMAGGKGTRLKPYTDILPKPLIPIGEKTITEHIMDYLGEYDCKDFFLIVNYKKELIKAYFSETDDKKNIRFIEEKEFFGTGGGISLLNGIIDQTFIFTNCDIILDSDYSGILAFHKQKGNIITMVCARKDYVIPYGTVVVSETGKIGSLTEKPHIQTNVNTGFYIIEPRLFDYIPKDTKIDITDLIKKCMESGEEVGAYLVDEEEWMDMGQFDELEKMKEQINRSKNR